MVEELMDEDIIKSLQLTTLSLIQSPYSEQKSTGY